jgi:hypothetical protein
VSGTTGIKGFGILGLLGTAGWLAHRTRKSSALTGVVVRAARALDRSIGWDKLPLPIGLGVLIANRIQLRQHNLHDTSSAPSTPRPPLEETGARHLTARTVDGSSNDLERRWMGRAGERFGRNVPIEHTYPEPAPAILEPNPRTVSRELLTRDTFLPVTTLNLLAGAWLQFMIRDWLSHGKSPKDNPWELPLAEDDPWHERPMTILRVRPDPTRLPGSDGLPPTYANTETHWWDGSQIYGSSRQHQQMVRSGQDGKLRVDPGGLLPRELLGPFVEEPGSWVGLAMLSTLFTLEHNAICDRLKAEYPSWSDDELFDHARLVTAALLAKIHTVEWTPGIAAHPTTQYALRANWWGIQGERLYRLFGRLSGSEVLSGIPGSATDHHTAPYAITEEFVAVYRMHPLMPDDFTFRSAANDAVLEDLTFPQVAGKHVLETLDRFSMTDLLYSFGRLHPGAITLHNYPRFLQRYERPDGHVMDLAATDILRTRELGVPRYNRFRRLLGLPAAASFEALTDNPVWADELRRVYDHDIERVDAMVGLYAEPLRAGFGFSDTAFRIFILMASRRLKSDRFFTTDYTPRAYTRAGLDWIDDNDMSSVLLRHFPALGPALRGVQNAFTPWSRVST